MRKGNACWMILGVPLGVAGSYWAARAYRAARASCPPFEKPTFRDSQSVVEAFSEFWHDPAAIHSLRTNPRIDRAFAAKAMLMTAGASGSRTCSRLHLRYAQQQGLSLDQATSLLHGELEYATLDEAAALYFVSDFVKSGNSDPDLLVRLVDTYGERTARDVLTLVRMLTFANLVGNGLDALVSRFLGQPGSETSLRDDLAVLALFKFGIVPLMPVLAFRSALGVARQRAARSGR